MTKSDVVREFIANNPEVPRKDVHNRVYEKYPDIFGSRKKAWAVVQNVYKHPDIPIKPTPLSSSAALTETQLREMFDIRSIVISELKGIPKGEFYRDHDFARRFQGKPGFRSILQGPEASAYCGKAQSQIFWGHPDSVKKMKSEGILI